MGNKYALIKPLKNKHIQWKEVLQLFSHEEIKEGITSKTKTVWLFVIHKTNNYEWLLVFIHNKIKLK